MEILTDFITLLLLVLGLSSVVFAIAFIIMSITTKIFKSDFSVDLSEDDLD